MPSPVNWTVAEDFYLITNSSRLSLKQLCADLQKSQYAIRKRIDVLDLRNVKPATSATPNSRFRSGFRDDLGVKVRSGWEACVLRWLNHVNIEWVYEPRRFYFDGVRRGAHSYMPDIYLPNYEGSDRWLEIKGRLPPSDRTKLRRFRKFYPEEFQKLMMIPPSRNSEAYAFCRDMEIPVLAFFRELDKEFRDVIPNWEA